MLVAALEKFADRCSFLELVVGRDREVLELSALPMMLASEPTLPANLAHQRSSTELSSHKVLLR